MSAIAEESEGLIEPLRVLITMHDGMDTLDFAGPLEVLSFAQHHADRPASKAFQTIFAGPTQHVTTAQGAILQPTIDYTAAMARLSDIDVLIVPGGGTDPILKTKSQPLTLIKAFSDLQQKNPTRERTLMSVCTGALFLADAGVLSGLSATTHPDQITKLEILCSNAAQRDLTDRTDVVEQRYVVNNLRFELGENEAENPYILNRKELKEQKRRKSLVMTGLPSPLEEEPLHQQQQQHAATTTNGAHANGPPSPTSARRASFARKGSMSLKLSNSRRESVIKRANLRLGGLRVLTTSGVTSGIDGALYLVGALVSDDAAEEVARKMCHGWKKGMVVDGTDV